jgi:hypothetical protein
VRDRVDGRGAGAVPIEVLPLRHHLSDLRRGSDFLVPFAVAFTGLPVGAFIAILVFLLLLLEGLVWAWGKGCLDWAK